MSWQLSHLVNNRWWPLGLSSMTFSLMCVVLMWFKSGLPLLLGAVRLFGLSVVLIVWFRDIIRERAYQGTHTLLVQGGLKWGLIWFLFSEIWFFFRVFWRFFHFRLAPITRSISDWPGKGLLVISPFQVPLLNTVILLIRGVTATLAHNQLLAGQKSEWISGRVLLGIYFIVLQGFEYSVASYSVATGAYGRVFFFGTGFHGMHVCLGAIMLVIRACRTYTDQFSSQHHFGVEFRLWYWHFVDVVWLFLFFWVYAWGR